VSRGATGRKTEGPAEKELARVWIESPLVERKRERERERDARVHAKGYIEREGEQITAEARGREAAVGVRGWFLGRRAAGES